MQKYEGFVWEIDGEPEWETAFRRFWFGKKHGEMLYTETRDFIREILSLHGKKD